MEIIDEVRQEMSREADYDVDLFAEMIRNGQKRTPISATKIKKNKTLHNKLSKGSTPES